MSQYSMVGKIKTKKAHDYTKMIFFSRGKLILTCNQITNLCNQHVRKRSVTTHTTKTQGNKQPGTVEPRLTCIYFKLHKTKSFPILIQKHMY